MTTEDTLAEIDVALSNRDDLHAQVEYALEHAKALIEKQRVVGEKLMHLVAERLAFISLGIDLERWNTEAQEAMREWEYLASLEEQT